MMSAEDKDEISKALMWLNQSKITLEDGQMLLDDGVAQTKIISLDKL